MTRKTNILLPYKFMKLLDACMEFERLRANNITGLNTCTKWSAVKIYKTKTFEHI